MQEISYRRIPFSYFQLDEIIKWSNGSNGSISLQSFCVIYIHRPNYLQHGTKNLTKVNVLLIILKVKLNG